MVNPGAFQGSRKEFLLQERQNYSDAIAQDCLNDVLANIYRMYFKRYPVDLPHDQEPTAESLEKANNDEADDEPEEPDADSMGPEEYKQAMQELDECRALIKKRKKQIRGWLHYQYMKEHEVNESHPDNPYRILLCQLNGTGVPRPRLQVTRNVWRKNCRQPIEKETRRRAEAEGIPSKNLAPTREKVAKEMFDALSEQQKAEWGKRAKEEHTAAMKSWEASAKAGPSNTPKSRQQCINSLASFVQPILDGICAYTGWKATLIAGGPSPAHEGQMAMLSIHSGTTKGDTKMNFGRAERHHYDEKVTKTFGSFLRKCYLPEDCRAAASHADEDPSCLADPLLDSPELLRFSDLEATSVGTKTPLGSVSQRASAAPTQNETQSPSPNDRDDTPPVSIQRASDSTPPMDVADASNIQTTVGSSVVPNSTTATVLARTPAPTSPPHPSPVPSRPPSPAPSAPPSPPLHNPQPPSQSIPLNVDSQPQSLVPAKRSAPVDTEDNSVGSTSPALKTSKKSRFAVPLTNARDVGSEGTSERPRRDRKPSAKAASQKSQPARPAHDTPLLSTSATKPKWFIQSMAMFKSEDLGERWTAVLAAWAAFEEKEGYQQATALTATRRPQVVNNWIAARRSSGWRPSDIVTKTYAREVKDWWASLQPDWRLEDGNLVEGSIDGDLGCLRRSGLNGLHSFVASLFFWGLSAKRGMARKQFLDSLDDCIIVFNALAA